MILLAEFLFELLVFLLVDVLLQWTGEILAFGFTLGRRKPVFRLWGMRTLSKTHLPDQASLFAGICFWAVILLILISS